MQLKPVIEGLLYIAGDDGLETGQLARILETDETTVRSLLTEMAALYQDDQHGIDLVEVAGVFKFATKPQLAPYIQQLFTSTDEASLSQAAMETLAIVAYKQPITKAEIEEIRGVGTDRPLRTLTGRALIKETGRAEGVGRAILYGTTDEFMEDFGLRTLAELPSFPEELEDADESEVALFDPLQNKDDHRE